MLRRACFYELQTLSHFNMRVVSKKTTKVEIFLPEESSHGNGGEANRQLGQCSSKHDVQPPNTRKVYK